MVLVIDDRFWGLLDTPFRQGVSEPLLGTKSKMCPSCDAGSLQPLSYERVIPQDPVLTASNSLDDPAGTVHNDAVTMTASAQMQKSSDGGSNTVTSESGGQKEEMSDLTKVETVIAGLGIIVLMAVAITYGLKTILHK